MSGAHTESVIKAIIPKIVQECAMREQAVSASLVDFMLRTILLDPRNLLDADQILTRLDIRKLEELCLDRLSCSLSQDTIKMQMYYDKNYRRRCDYLLEIHRKLESKMSPMKKEITDSKVEMSEDIGALYGKIVSYILLCSCMGSPTVHAVQETSAALQSFFPWTELGAFLVLPKRVKEQQLNELAMIVTGIRIFNRGSKKGEEEFYLHQLMPAALHEALRVTTQNIDNELSVTQRLAWKYTALLENLPNRQSIECDMPLDLLKQALYNVRQHEAFLKQLQAEAGSCAKNAVILQKELSSRRKWLKGTMQSKTFGPIAKAFPHFKALSELWSKLQVEAELLKIFNNIVLSLKPFLSSQDKIFPESSLDSWLRGSQVKTDEQRFRKSSNQRIKPDELKLQEWLLPKTASFTELPLQYNGLCGYTLVSTDGLLLPGNPHIGVLKHQEKLYAFNSKEAALKFADSPDEFIAAAAEKAKASPELSRLLNPQLHVDLNLEMQPGDPSLVRCDISTQTDLHPVEANIVKSYDWNQWEMRRKAIKLANLRTTVTHSTQTDQSHNRRDNVSQTWLPKEAACQTRTDGWSNTPSHLLGSQAQMW
ncbi:cilia- and flagella-associated protein 206-like [Aulostomus maculatus]